VLSDDLEPSLGPPAPGAPTGRRWLRWGTVYVDIEPPDGPNPWTARSVATGPALEAEAPAAPPGRRRRLVAAFVGAAVLGALVTMLVFLLVRRGRDDRAAVAPAASTTTTTARSPVTRPSLAPATRPTTRPTTGATTPSRPDATTAPSSSPAPPTTAGARGPITVPEGTERTTIAPSTSPSTSPSTAPPSSTAPVRPVPPTTAPEAVAFLGVSVEDAVDGPAVVEVVPGSGAERAGVLPGDVVLAIDRTAVATVDDLGAAITSRRPGDTVTVTVLRNGAQVTVTATLGTRP
jgi:membrane-associated protease RseP (regulator of RpoE activity)